MSRRHHRLLQNPAPALIGPTAEHLARRLTAAIGGANNTYR
ncbi:MAG: hypothetical protein ACKVIY_00630 [Acidimicrobiales bacterium]